MDRISRAALAASAFIALPALAGAPDTAVVEYYNTQTRHYFVTATASEARLVDAGAAGPGWARTGRSFQAWLDPSSATGSVPVCRFYSTMANSHFYTASAQECASLQAQAAVERATSGVVRGWQFEGIAFHVLPATGGSCPAGTEPITRTYNNGFANGEGSNHRFVDDPALQRVMANDHWSVEGVAFCSPVLSTGTQAVLPDTTTAFAILAGTWSGNARVETETSSGESHGVVPMQLVVDADGKVTGSGGGCDITGTVEDGDGFRSLFTGTATLGGCTNPALNGSGQDLRLQRFGQSVLMAQFHQEAAGTETTVSATLTNKPASAPGNAQGLSSVAGDWAGTVGFEAEDASGHETEGNKPLALSISTTGAVTGTGYGCTFTGNLSLPAQGRTFAATITAAGCTSTLFNGTYDHARVILDGQGRLHVAMELEGSGGSAEISGTLVAATDTPTPPPTATTLAGGWQGTLAFAVGSSTSNATTTLTVGTSGAISGTAGTCTFGGSVTLAPGATETTTGSITLTGCTAAALDGTYTAIKLALQGGSLLVDLQRTSGTTTTHVSGTLTPKA